MKKSLIILLGVVALIASSCSAINQTMREPNVRFDLNSSDYVLSDAVTGEADVTLVFGIDWARLFKSTAGAISYPVVGAILPSTTNYAIYDLMSKNPGYDFIMYPQVYTKETNVIGIVITRHIKVTARLGKLKR